MCIGKNRRKVKNTNYKNNKSKSKKMKKELYNSKSNVGVPKLTITNEERNSRIALMRAIFEVQSDSRDCYDMITFITSFIDGLNDNSIIYELDREGNIYVTKGNARTYPCLVSHTDTVHRIIDFDDYVVLNSDTEFFAINLKSRMPTGIGGDDKNGIYCCLDALVREDFIKLAFFVDEEIGCVGSSNCNMDFFNDVSFVLQADRQGYEDVAIDIMYTEMFGQEFYSKVEGLFQIYGRDICEGGMTDVMQLAHNGLDVAMANFSCGYYRPHSDMEYVIIDELILTSILFRDIIKECYVDGERNEFIRKDSHRPRSQYSYYGYGKSQEAIHDAMADEYDMGDSRKLLAHSVDNPISDTNCSICGYPLEWDITMNAHYCNNCMDYDYNANHSNW